MSGRAWAGAALALCMLAAAGTPLAAGTLAYEVRAEMIVLDADAAGRRLTAWAEKLGGYFLVRSMDSVVLRIPAARVGELRPLLEEVAEVVVSYAPSTQDVREELAAVEASLTSREEALSLILRDVDRADVEGTLALEREVTGLMTDLESLQGRKRLLQNNAAFARVEVSLSARRQAVPTQRASSFAWVNTVDLYRFLEEVLPYDR
jgi:hypothetical protein